MGKIIGLDVGIGSLGWAVINEDKRRIEDLGVRIFESGEVYENNKKMKSTQIRRKSRSLKRLYRRRGQRKIALKKKLNELGIITLEEIDIAYSTKGFNPDVWKYRAEGLYRKLDPIELTAVLINFANYRGYNDFYADSEEDKEGKLTEAKNAISAKYENDCIQLKKYRTIGEMIYLDKSFRDSKGRLEIRNNAINKDGKKEPHFKYLIDREYLKKELHILLNKQNEFGYKQLTPDACVVIEYIIFNQRDFEDGPGPKNNPVKYKAMENANRGNQHYSGFDELIGFCPFYPTESRGYQNSLIYDMYVLINELSQLHFYNSDNEEICCPETMVTEMFLLMFENEGVLKYKEIEKLAKKNKVGYDKPKGITKKQITGKYIKFLMKENNFTDTLRKEFAMTHYDDQNSLAEKIGDIMSKNATPSRREKELQNEFDKRGLKPEFVKMNYGKAIKVEKMGGGASVSFKYMLEAIRAYFDGVKYGDFQANTNETADDRKKYKIVSSTGKILPIMDKDMVRNPVVYRSLNETRKIVNYLMRQYKDVTAINVEVAKDVGQSFEQRAKTKEYQDKNAEKNEALRNKLYNEMINKGYNEHMSDMVIARYTLWESQKKMCIYSGEEITFDQVIRGTTVQVDHIIPQSIVLDETLNNKVLVLTTENQKKGNKVPLEYMDKEQAEEYKNRVLNLYRTNDISRIKKEYLLLPNLNDSEKIRGFVDRNINDTRTISKYVAVLLDKAFCEKGIKVNVIKGSVTSRFRRRWLGRRTRINSPASVYGLEKKTRDLHYYHHAIDAAVVANLTRKYIELGQDYEKISSIRKEYDKHSKNGNSAHAKTLFDSMNNEIEKTVKKMHDQYHMSEDYVRNCLDYAYVPSIVDNFRKEIEVRVPLVINMKVNEYERDNKNYKELKTLLGRALSQLESDNDAGEEFLLITPTLVEQINERLSDYDSKLAAISEKGELVKCDGDRVEKSTKENFTDLKKYIKSMKEPELKNYIEDIHFCFEEEYSERVMDYYDDKEFASKIKVPYISYKISRRYRGDMVSSSNPVSCRKVFEELNITTMKEFELKLKDLKCPYYVKINNRKDEPLNFSIYAANKFYCIEIYVDENNKYQIRGIRFIDIRRDRKKGALVLTRPLPKSCKHVMYLFHNEYIRLCDKKGNLKKNGMYTYRSVKNINANRGYARLYSSKNYKGEDIIVTLSTPIKKVNVSILGHIEGEVKCGDQSLFIVENT